MSRQAHRRMLRRGARSLALGSGIVITALLAAGCASGGGEAPDAGDATGTITIWAQEGQEGEVQAAKDVVAAFNESQDDITAELTLIPQATYGQTLASTDVDALPDVYEFDGETLGALVYAGKLRQLDGLVADDTIQSQIPSILAEGTYSDGNVYAVAQYDSGLGLYGNASLLAAAGITDVPTTVEDAWTVDEFQDAVVALAGVTPGGKGLDIKENYAGTWPGYAFTPVVNSAGQPLVKGGSAEGTLNAPEVADALTRFATWRQYVDPNADDKAFTDGRVGLSWVGHWNYPSYAEALGDDLVVLPLPDFGNGTKSGQGSHAWGIGANSPNAAAGAKFLEFLMQDEWITQITTANGAVPGTTSAIAASELYAEGGPLRLYYDQLQLTCGSEPPTPDCVTVPRTISPAWPVINSAFSEAFWAIYGGADAQTELDKAVKTIDLDYADNGGYED
ncbi:extracellular solute-binding protein [Microbacterium lacus]|uniref:Sugar ABC transporter substrate-binding protein n=1 Tax=Microbacterium lacus TaxID=415217 RepID=A0ABN2HAM3_9MICO